MQDSRPGECVLAACVSPTASHNHHYSLPGKGRGESVWIRKGVRGLPGDAEARRPPCQRLGRKRRRGHRFLQLLTFQRVVLRAVGCGRGYEAYLLSRCGAFGACVRSECAPLAGRTANHIVKEIVSDYCTNESLPTCIPARRDSCLTRGYRLTFTRF